MAATHMPMLHMICGKVAAGKSTLQGNRVNKGRDNGLNC